MENKKATKKLQKKIMNTKDSQDDVFEDENMGEFYELEEVIRKIHKAEEECEE